MKKHRKARCFFRSKKTIESGIFRQQVDVVCCQFFGLVFAFDGKIMYHAAEKFYICSSERNFREHHSSIRECQNRTIATDPLMIQQDPSFDHSHSFHFLVCVFLTMFAGIIYHKSKRIVKGRLKKHQVVFVSNQHIFFSRMRESTNFCLNWLKMNN